MPPAATRNKAPLHSFVHAIPALPAHRDGPNFRLTIMDALTFSSLGLNKFVASKCYVRVIAGDTLIAGALPWHGGLRWQGCSRAPLMQVELPRFGSHETLLPAQRTLWGGISPKSRQPIITSTKDLWNWLCILLGSPHTIPSQAIPLGISSTEPSTVISFSRKDFWSQSD